MSASDEIWILGIRMTKFGKHPALDTVDLAAEAATGARHDGRPARQAAWPAQCVALGGCTHGVPISA